MDFVSEKLYRKQNILHPKILLLWKKVTKKMLTTTSTLKSFQVAVGLQRLFVPLIFERLFANLVES